MNQMCIAQQLCINKQETFTYTNNLSERIYLISAQRKRVVIINLPGNIYIYIHTYVRNQTSSHPAIMETAVLFIE